MRNKTITFQSLLLKIRKNTSQRKMGLLTPNLSIAFIFCSTTLLAAPQLQSNDRQKQGVIFRQKGQLRSLDREISRTVSRSLSTLVLGFNTSEYIISPLTNNPQAIDNSTKLLLCQCLQLLISFNICVEISNSSYNDANTLS